MNKKDLILIISIIILSGIVSALFSVNHNSDIVAECVVIRVNGDIYKTLSLDEDGEYKVETVYGNNIIVIKNKSVYISEADCRGNDCINEGSISRAGETIICLPHKLSITLEGDNSVVDTVTY